MRLFVALELPQPIARALADADIAPNAGVRRVPPEQMHVTLHFIGDADAGELRRALARVHGKPCLVTVEGVGRFAVGGGRRILWAGVTESPELLELHTACGSALATTGFRVERRRFVPHVTLARLAPSAPASIVNRFLRASSGKRFGEFVATRFVLYDSVAVTNGIRYEVVDSWELS